MSDRPDPDDEEPPYTVTVGGVAVEPEGAIMSMIVFHDGESFFSRLSPLRDITDRTPRDSQPTAYSFRGWLTDMVRSPDDPLICGDDDGRVHIQRSAGWDVEPTGGRGLRTVWTPGGEQIFAAGTEGRVWRRGPEGWADMGRDFGQWLNDIDGRGADDFFVVGDAGIASRWTGEAWSDLDLPTSATLACVKPLPDGRWLIGGANGTLFRGSEDEWEDLSGDVSSITDIAIGREGTVWLACGAAGAGRLADDGSIEIVRDTFAARRVQTSGDYTVFAGNNIVARFDGKAWAGWGYT